MGVRAWAAAVLRAYAGRLGSEHACERIGRRRASHGVERASLGAGPKAGPGSPSRLAHSKRHRLGAPLAAQPGQALVRVLPRQGQIRSWAESGGGASAENE